MKIILFANTDWYLYNFRLALAEGLRHQGDDVVLVSPPGDYGPMLEKAGFRWVPIPLSRGGTDPLHDLFTLHQLYLLYKKERPDFVHNFTIKCVLYSSMAARLAGESGWSTRLPDWVIFLQSWAESPIAISLVGGFYKIALQNTRVIFQNSDDQALFINEKLVSEGQTS